MNHLKVEWSQEFPSQEERVFIGIAEGVMCQQVISSLRPLLSKRAWTRIEQTKCNTRIRGKFLSG